MPTELTIPRRSMPKGYVYVPKGNVFITGNCRKLTHASGQKVFIVVAASNDKKPIGIAVPVHIHHQVQAKEKETRSDRAAAVVKRDNNIEQDFAKAVREEYPRIPEEAVSHVLKMALQKGKGKVGRTGTLGLDAKARLAVRAHIRHHHTAYEAHLRSMTMTREEAREAVMKEVNAVAEEWGQAPKTRDRISTTPPEVKNTTDKAAVAAGVKVGVPAQHEGPRMIEVIGGGKPDAAHKPSDLQAGRNQRKEPENRTTKEQLDTKKTERKTAKREQRFGKRRRVAREEAERGEAQHKKADKAANDTQKIDPHRQRPQTRFPRVTTRSMGSIRHSMQELAGRLPDDADLMVECYNKAHRSHH